jgi:transposase
LTYRETLQAVALQNQGLSFRKIEKQLGLGKGTIRKGLKKLGIYYGKMDQSSQCYYLNKSG